VMWHQDTALPLQERRETRGWGPWSIKDGVNYAHAPASALRQVLALRVHLDDSTAKNGPLRVLPGTHTLGVLTDKALHELSTEIAPVECLVSEGGVLAMRPLIVHASSKSISAARGASCISNSLLLRKSAPDWHSRSPDTEGWKPRE
jgi:ectoine hydroxylase-related dioxygenase (phytanoyl-CoA dioxygenase family)